MMEHTVTFTVRDMNTRLSICPVCSTPAPLLGTTCSKCGANLFEVPSQLAAHPAADAPPSMEDGSAALPPDQDSAPDADEVQVEKEMQEEEASVNTADAAADAPIVVQDAADPTAKEAPPSEEEESISDEQTPPAGADSPEEPDPGDGDDPDSMLLAPETENDDELFAPTDESSPPASAEDTTTPKSPSSTWSVRGEAEDGASPEEPEVEPGTVTETSTAAPDQGSGQEEPAVQGDADAKQEDESEPPSGDPPLPPGFPATENEDEGSWNEGTSSEREYVLTHPALSDSPPPLAKPESEPFSTSEEFHEPDPMGKAETVPVRSSQMSDAKVMLVAVIVVLILLAVAAVLTHVVKL